MAKRKKEDERDLQPFAITFLLCAPSTLQKAWLESEATRDWERALEDLGVTDKNRALKLMTQLSERKTLFAAIGELLHDSTDEYDLDPPHPARPLARLLLARLK